MSLKKEIIGLCHGVFDIVHYGHIKHFETAKKKVDKLVVSVTIDDFVNKGVGRPIFSVDQRVNYLKNLKIVDEVIVSKTDNAINSLKKIKPNFFFKGSEYKNQKNYKYNSFFKEKDFCKKNKIKIYFTNDKIYSSSNLINSYSEFDKNLNQKIKLIKKNYTAEKIIKIIKKALNQKISVIGDPIIDTYQYCETVGTSSKSPSLAMVKKKTENYLGGSLAVAYMLSALGANKVKLINFFNLKKLKTINKFDKKIITKNILQLGEIPNIKRIIDEPRFMKMLQIYNLKNVKLSKKEESKIVKYINNDAKSDKLILVTDFGFGFLPKNVRDAIDNSKSPYTLNCHINAININYNYYHKYKKFSYITFNKREFLLNFRGNFNLEENIKLVKKNFNQLFAVTKGLSGSIIVNKKKEYHFPAIYKKIVDPVGCGDAYFAITSILTRVSKDYDLINFLGNLYAGIHAMTVCNKTFITQRSFFNSIKTMLS